MPQPVRSDVHIDTLLSNVSIQYANEPSSYVADKVFPILSVKKQSDKIAQYSKDNMFRDEAKQRAPLTESEGSGFGVDTPATYYCDRYGIHQDLANDDIDGADSPYDLRKDATRVCIEKLKLRREIMFASTYFTAGVWDNDLQGQTDTPTTNQFLCWDQSSSTPLEDIDGAKLLVRLATGSQPNVLLVSERVHTTLKRHSDIRDMYKYTSSESLTPELLAKAFEVDQYLVAKAVKATNNEGATTSLAYTLDQYGALLVYAAPKPSKYQITGGYIIQWNRPRNNNDKSTRFMSTVKRYNMDELDGERVETNMYYDLKLICSGCGVFFNNAIANGRSITAVSS